MAPLAWWPGPIVAILIVAPWLVAIQIATNGAFLRDAIFGDLAPKLAGGHEGHSGYPGFHLALLALTFFPATIGLGQGAILAWNALRAPRTDGSQGAFRFLIAWAVPTWLVFELLPTKLPHYVLPTFPALALFAGAGLVAAEARNWRVSPLISFIFLSIGAAALVALITAATTFMPGDQAAGHRRAIQTLFVCGAGTAATLAAILFVKQPALRVGLAVGVAVAGAWLLRERILPEARTLQVSTEVAAALRRNNLEEAPLAVIGYRETSLAFETRTDARLLAEQDWRNVAGDASAGEAVAITCSKTRDFTATLRQRGLDLELVAEIRGRNYGNGDDVCLDLGRVSARSALLPRRLAKDGPDQLP
jgi:4-amino-4-deoxy-L-arabinose transferase-like glycosyltransferase